MQVKVKLFGKLVGVLAMHNSKVYFEYDEDFKKQNIEISPIKLNSHKTAVYTNNDDGFFEGLPGVFADSLPDKFGNKIIDKYFTDKGITNFNVIQKLAYVGTSAMGALEYEPTEVNQDSLQPLALQSLVHDAKLALSGDVNEAIPAIMEAGASAGGARAKAVIGLNKNTQEIISGRDTTPKGFESYILKFDGMGDDSKSQDYTKIEYIYMQIAELCGLNVAETELYSDRNYKHLLVKRFDRIASQKLHMHTLCGMTHANFNQPIFSYEEYLRTVSIVTRKQNSVVDAYAHMIFNVISCNQDDHTKNFSFLMDEFGTWSNAPVYDLTYSNGGGYTQKHQMSINGKYTNFEEKDLLAVATSANIGFEDAHLIIAHFQDTFQKNFKTMAEELLVDKARIKRIIQNCRTF
jgi:serine/threonine-protein kinase HipA